MLTSDLKLFLAVTSTGSLSAAARQLDVTPMQVSRRVAALEEELGVRLFHRSTRSVSLTAEGEALLPHAIAMSEAEENARHALGQTSNRVSGVLRVSTPSIFGQSIVLALLPRLLEDYPDLKVEVHISEQMADIVAQGMDVALRIGPLPDSELVARKITVNPRLICASPAYLQRRGLPTVVSDLDDHDCIILDSAPRWPFVIDQTLQPKRVHGRCQTTSVDAVRAAALEGLGLAMLTCVDVCRQLKDGSLVQVHLQDASLEELAVWAILPSRRYVPARVRVFLEALEADLAQLPI